MKPEQQIKALAELDGFENLDRYFKQPASVFGKMQDMGTQDGRGESLDLLGRELKPVPDYLHSYDAIIPLIQRQNENTKRLFVAWLITMLNAGQFQWDATPAQICEALLRATGKWID